jgi:hypothetical protein
MTMRERFGAVLPLALLVVGLSGPADAQRLQHAGEAAPLVLAQRGFDLQPGFGGGWRRPSYVPPRDGGPGRPRRPPVWGGVPIDPPLYTRPPLYVVEDEPPPRRVRPQQLRQRAVAPQRPQRAAAVVRPAASDFVADEVLFAVRPNVSPAQADALARRLRLSVLERADIRLTGNRIIRARVARGQSVPASVRALNAEPRVARAQPNFIFSLQQADKAGASPPPAVVEPPTAAPPAGAPDLVAAQYAPAKLKLATAHAIARGRSVVVAVVDSGVDAGHPELDGSLVAPSGAKPHAHGTGMAGAIAAHARLLGVAPAAVILDLPAFGARNELGARGATLDIVRALDTAADNNARVVNLSFAGPQDALLEAALRALHRRGALLVAAAGNAGPQAKPLYPAAYPFVLAVTATDSADQVYAMANAGAHIAAAAPGVDVLLPAPGGSYQQLSGSSVAAAHVSGLAALLLELRPSLTPDDVRATLIRTARDLGAPGRDPTFGAGLVDAAAALAVLRETAQLPRP